MCLWTEHAYRSCPPNWWGEGGGVSQSIISSHPCVSPLNAELNPIRHLLALLENHHIFHVSSVRVKHNKHHGYSIVIAVTMNHINQSIE